MVKIACLQVSPRPCFASAWEEINSYLNHAIDHSAQFILLPEYCGGLKTENGLLKPPAALEDDHPILAKLIAVARENRVWVLIGSIAVNHGELIKNRSYLINDHGQILARYDKIHLFDIQLSEKQIYQESAVVDPGSEAVVVDTCIGQLGMSVCYDLRFPQLYRTMCQRGAQVLTIPAAFLKKTGEAHWHVLNRARAIENGAYVIAPCAVGPIPGGGHSYGHTLVVDPWGKVVMDGGNEPCVKFAHIDTNLVNQTRHRIPSLRHDRDYNCTVIDLPVE
ncbi:MAG: carbon-nitrogen hydrolase family protein [Rhodobacteraceae bacterium]|nr:carbon-nitrogen hydrolase family protein [Paracoccaceae bacterium]